jgi:hypothetical protein
VLLDIHLLTPIFDLQISLYVCSMLVEWNVIPYFGVIIDTSIPGCVGVSGRSQPTALRSLKLHPANVFRAGSGDLSSV